MIWASWRAQYRLFGVQPLSETVLRRLRWTSEDAGRAVDVVIELANKPSEPIPLADVPRFVAAGLTMLRVEQREFPHAQLHEVTSIWLTVMATAIYSVAEELAAQFHGDPPTWSGEVSSVLKPGLERELRPITHLVAGIWGVRIPTAVMHLYGEQDCYWHSGTNYEGLSFGDNGESIAVVQLEQESLLPILIDATASLRRSEEEKRILERAVHHYVKGRSEIVGSMDRFLGMFMALESLSHLAPLISDLAFVRQRSELLQVVETSAPALISFAERLLNRQPSLNTRFTALTKYVGLATSDSDLKLFRKLNSFRADFAHGRFEDPTDQEERELSNAAEELAVRYIGAILDRFREEGMALGKIVLPP